jgi:acyl-CoA thioesterase-2
MTRPPQESIKELLRHIDLRPTDYDRFRGDVEQDEGRLFGGLVLAQSVMAAGRTVDKGDIHSLHAYFLRAGQPVEPIDYAVERIRQGRNFFTRRVTALQAGHTIFEASVSFTLSEDGLSHQLPMPPAPDPEGQPSWWEMMQKSMPPEVRRQMNRRHRGRRGWAMPIDIRGVSSGPGPGDKDVLPHRAVWARPLGELPEDPLIHAAAMAYMSDSGLVATVASFRMFSPSGTAASLDHAMWFHHPPRFDDWLLYVNESPAAHAARALILGRMYRRDGTLVASVAQEGLFRAQQSAPAAQKRS